MRNEASPATSAAPDPGTSAAPDPGTSAAPDRGPAVLSEVADGIGWITFSNPTRHNALSVSMLTQIPELLAGFDANPDVAVVVMRGAGERAFVSGADISEFGERRSSPEARAAYDEVSARALEAWQALTKPVIAMIAGYCIGGGLNVALEADIRIASTTAQFAIPAARLGLGYGFERVRRLAAVVGASWAAEILFSARRLSAQEALAIGLVNRVAEAEDLEAEVTQLARTIAANAPLTVRAAKAAIHAYQRDPGSDDAPAIAALIEACFTSEDYQEGQRAFLEKRPPVFRGR